MNYAVTTEKQEPRPASRRATDIAALRAIAQATVDVELFTIPLYMAAMYSIQGMHQITGKDQDFYRGRLWPGPATTANPATANEKAFNIMFSVFIEEMLHLQMAANIATCAGHKPKFTSSSLQNDDHGWKCYGPNKTTIPYIVNLEDTKSLRNAKVNIDALTPGQVRLFKAIEQDEKAARDDIIKNQEKYFPEVPFEDWKPGDDLPMFGTISHMYRCYFKYMSLHYDDNPSKRLWDYVYDPAALQRDLFNVESPPGHPAREFPGFDTTIIPLDLAKIMMSAITDQGEGKELPLLSMVKEKYQASEEALKADYPSYTDTGKSAKSKDAAARFRNGKKDHYERFTELEKLVTAKRNKVVTWPEWHKKRKGANGPWKAEDLHTLTWKPKMDQKYGLPTPATVAAAMNKLGRDEKKMHALVSKVAVGSIAGITTVLNDYWEKQDVLFPYPSMAGSGDRMAICWALFGKAPDLSASPGASDRSKLLHACQGLDFAYSGGKMNDCAPVEIFHSCRGSNDCKARGGCGFVQKDSGGGMCGGFALVKAKTQYGAALGDEQVLYSAPSDNKCPTFGGCAVPISQSQIMPQGGTMKLYDFDGPKNTPKEIGTMEFSRGDKVYNVAYEAYKAVMKSRKQNVKVPENPPEPNSLRLAFPPST